MSVRVRVGDELELDIVGSDEHGHGLAEHDDRRVSVPGVFPGERARVRIEALARHGPLAHARVRELIVASEDRRELPCARHEHVPGNKLGCGGCPLMALNIEAQRELERRRIAADYGLELDGPILGGDEFGYRWSSKRAAYGRPGRLRLGSRLAGRQRDDRVANMRGCLVDHPRLREAFDELERVANELELAPWGAGADATTNDTDALRYAWAKTNGEQVLMTLIGSVGSVGSVGTKGSRVFDELGRRLHAGGRVEGVAFSAQSGPGNAIRGEPPRHVAGLEHLTLELLGVTLELGPLGFLQPNPQVAALAYRELIGEHALEHVGRLALDLYAGAGVTTRLLQARFDEVVPCEAYEESAAALGVAPSSAEAFCRAWLEGGRPTPDLIVANPPRAGLGEAVCASLLELRAPALRIMSCSAKTLAADLRRLTAGNSYELVSLRGYDTLPQTPHVELVAGLVLKDPVHA